MARVPRISQSLSIVFHASMNAATLSAICPFALACGNSLPLPALNDLILFSMPENSFLSDAIMFPKHAHISSHVWTARCRSSSGSNALAAGASNGALLVLVPAIRQIVSLSNSPSSHALMNCALSQSGALMISLRVPLKLLCGPLLKIPLLLESACWISQS